MRNDLKNDLCTLRKGEKRGKSETNKIVLTSSSHADLKTQRKPVKECYCISDASKTDKKSTDLLQKISSQDSRGNVKHVEKNFCQNTTNNFARLPGCETVKRAERITYLPSSEFLRRVHKKVCCSRKKNSCSQCSPSSSSENTFLSVNLCREALENCIEREFSKGRNLEAWNTCQSCNATSDIRRDNGAQSCRSLMSTFSDNRGNNREKEKIEEMRGKSRIAKKMVNSRKSVQREKPEKLIRTISNQNRCCYSKRMETLKKSSESLALKPKFTNESRWDCENETITNGKCNCQISRNRIIDVITRENEEKVKELSKFRLANYFETHGSVNSLGRFCRSSSVSTVEEPPCCSAKKSKKIHYYPSYVVREEGTTNDTICRKKIRCRNLDTVGHIVDLGILKIPCEFSCKHAFKSH